ncbi:MAG TPA: phage tail tape measure protein [Lachnospiraceae bacterium]|nr:phage tail tape measure protein [uncultured Lachnoclostridium sp.]HAU85086.1 phage tail tape measure protein [Lachnospiraceae bacterium]
MSDQKLTVSLILNSSSFAKQIQDVNRQVKLTESEFGKVASSTKDFASSMDGAKSKVKNLTDKLELQGKKVSLYQNEVNKTKTTLSELTKKYGEVDSKLASSNKKYDEACQKYGKNSKEAKALKDEIEKLDKSKQNLETRIVSTNGRLTSLQTELNKSETEFNKLDREVKDASESLKNFKLDQAKQSLSNLGDTLNATGDKFQAAGKKISNVGNKLALGVAAPLTAIGVGAAKVSVSFEKAMAQVQATSSASADEMAKLTDKATALGKSIAGASASDVAESFNYLALAGYNTNQMLAAIEPNVKASIAFNADMATVTDLATDSMSAMGMEAEQMGEYLDLVAQCSRNANTSAVQMMEAYVLCGGTMNKMGVPLQESAKVLSVLADNGLKGSEAGRSLQSVMVNLMGTTSTTEGALKKLGVSTYDSAGKFRGLEVVLGDIMEATKKMTDEQADMALAALGGKTQLTALNNALKVSDERYNDLEKSIANSKGALEEMYGVMSDTTDGQIETLKSQLEAIGIQIGKTLLPVINDFIAKVSEWLTKFEELSPETKEMIVKLGLFAVAGTGAIKMLGGLTSGLGSIIKFGGSVAKLLGSTSVATTAVAGAAEAAGVAAGAAATGGLGTFATALGGMAAAAAPWVAGGALIVGTGALIAHELKKEAIPAVDLFADEVTVTSKTVIDEFGNVSIETQRNVQEISEATATAVGAYIAMDDGVRNSMYGLYTSSTVITKETVESMKTQFAEMANTIKEGYAATCNENVTTLSAFFAKSDAISEEGEKGILQKTNKYYSDKQMAIQGYQDQINQILQTAADKNRELTEEEYQTVTDIQNKMREESVNALSEQEIEASLILERMKSYDGRMTAEMASEHIKNLNEQRDKAISAAEEEYDKVVKSIIKMRDETGTISKEQADKMIEEANRQKDDTIKAAQDTRDGAVKKMEDLNSDLTKSVNTTTGQIKTKWDELKDWWNGWVPKAKNFVANIFTKDKSGSGDSGSGKAKKAFMSDMAMNYSSSVSRSAFGLTDSIHVPSAYDVATEMRAAGVMAGAGIGSVEQTSSSGNNELTEALRTQNELLLQMVSLLTKNSGVNVSIDVDGKQIAKATAKYMDAEINTINKRKTRLGGAF